MKTNLLIIIGMIIFPLAIQHSFAMCVINEDWSDAPCMDMIINGHYPQEQVDRWYDYYDYKGTEFMEAKKQEMNQVIQNNMLQEWIDESVQNYNVWTYYYFSGDAPSSYPYHTAAFELINRDKMPLQNLISSHNPFWYDPEAWFVAGIIGSVIAIPIAVVWRKRK
jgi:hypothetical protein